MAFEDEFGCQIPDATAQKIMTVNDIVGFLEQNA
jgi:acyl carrier protein